MNPDYLQSVPKSARTASRAPRTQATPANGATKPAEGRTSARQHFARVLGAATLASLLAFALAMSPGPKQDASTRENPSAPTLAKGLKSVHTSVTDRKRARVGTQR